MRDTPLRYTIAQARRLYLHLLAGGTLKPEDIARLIASLEKLDNESLQAP